MFFPTLPVAITEGGQLLRGRGTSYRSEQLPFFFLVEAKGTICIETIEGFIESTKIGDP